jgi:hypothetical protein
LKPNGFAKEKLQKCLSKNPDYEIFCYNDDFEHWMIIEFTPIVSVDVEHSFSQYKNLLSDNRQDLIKKILECITLSNIIVSLTNCRPGIWNSLKNISFPWNSVYWHF